jgi:hypothetical protein
LALEEEPEYPNPIGLPVPGSAVPYFRHIEYRPFLLTIRVSGTA